MPDDNESLSTNGQVSVIVDMPTEEQNDPPVIVIAPDNSSSDIDPGTLDIGKTLGEFGERLLQLETMASEALNRAETAITIAEVSNMPEPEVQPEVILDPPEETPEESPSEESVEDKPKREHWLWRNGKNWRGIFGGGK